MNTDFESKISKIKTSVNNILEMEGDQTRVSDTWRAVLSTLEYVMDLSPKNLRRIRLHTEIFSGEFLNAILFSYPYTDSKGYAEGTGYNYSIQNMPSKYHLSEPVIPNLHHNNGNFGVKYKDKILNPELVRYQSYFENFYSIGMLDKIEKNGERSVVFEIGGGYGAIGHHLLKFFPKKVCYIAIDLPIMLMFTAAYIIANNPEAKIFCYDPTDPGTHNPTYEKLLQYDVVLLPNHRLSILKDLKRIDYVINTISMAEMSKEDVEEYVDFIKDRLTGYFYFQNYCTPWSYEVPLHQFVGKHFISLPALNTYDSKKDNKFNKYTFCFTKDQNVAEDLSKKEIKISAFNEIGVMSLGSGEFVIKGQSKASENFLSKKIKSFRAG